MLARSPRFALLLGSCLGLCLFKFTCKLIWKWALERVPVQMIANGQGVCIGGYTSRSFCPRSLIPNASKSFHFRFMFICFHFPEYYLLTLGGLGFYHFASLIYHVKLSNDVDKRCSCWVSVDTPCVHWWVSGLLPIVFYMNSLRVIRLWFERCSL
jgi:hypothetical protein